MVENNRSKDKFDKEFSFLFKSISEEDESRIISAIKHGDHKKYKKLIKDHDATFIEMPERSLSPLHHAVTCNNKDMDAIKKTINSVLQSGIDINHPDEQGNTPLMHVLNERKKLERKDFISRVKFLMERGANLGWSEEECEEEFKQIDHLIKQVVTSKNEIDDIYKAQQDLKEQAKKELSVHFQDIKDVSIHGHCAKIQLKGDKEEFKISEFLQSNFCKSNGISGFSTLHDNGKSGMHGFVSPEGVRHYVVTDRSYEMTLNWPANGINHTIKIHIDAEGFVTVDKKYLDQYKAGEIDIAANKDVKIGNLFLAEALAEGRWKEKQVQNGLQNETIRSGNSVTREAVQKNSATDASEVESQPVMTSAPPNCNISPIHYNGTPESQSSNSVLENQQQPVIQRQSENQQQQANNQQFTTFTEDEVNAQNPNASLQTSNQRRPKRTPPPTPLRVSSLIKGQQQHENQQQSADQQKGEDEELHNRWSGSGSDSGYSSPTTDVFESQINSQEAQEKQRQAAQEKGPGDEIYNLQSFFSENVEKSNPSQLEEFLKEIRGRSQQDNKGLRKVNTNNEESPQNKDMSELQLRFSEDNNGLKKVNHTNESPTEEILTDSGKPFPTSSPNSGSDSGFSFPTHTSHSRSQVDTDQLEERLIYIEQSSENEEAPTERRNEGVLTPNVQNSDKIKQEWDSTYDFSLHDDSGFEEEELEAEEELLEALEVLSEEFAALYDENEQNEQIDSETSKSNNAQLNSTDQVMSELNESLKKTNKGLIPITQVGEKSITPVNAHNPFSDCVKDKNNLSELLKRDAAQLEPNVLEGQMEDTSAESANSFGDSFDHNRVKCSNKGTQLSKKIQQPWIERVTTTPTNDKDKGLSRK